MADKMVTKEFILQEIIRTAKDNNNIPLGCKRFTKETGIYKYEWWGKYWTKWNDAIVEAGFNPNRMQPAYDKELLIRQIISFIRENNKFPTSAELRLKAHQSKDFPSHNTIRSRLGNKQNFINNIVNYCGKQPEYSDIVEICNKAKTQLNEKEIQAPIMKTAADFGYVYLMKSGTYYKIGRSDSPGRRNYELGIKLPEQLETIHVITTDDPDGIEAYWHNRLKDKRKKGEWFDLSKEDVSAFKRRNFM
jgi:hypothetical protein